MNKSSWFLVGTVGVLLSMSCGGESNMVSSGDSQFTGTQFDVRYEVRFLSPGAVKITYKDNNGTEITVDGVSENWQREYTFGAQVDALLDLEASEIALSDPVTVRLAIYVNGNRVQQATALIGEGTKSNISYSRP